MKRLRFVFLLLFALSGEAHKPITSKYTYNEDVFPIVNARCGSCHVSGGVAPMSLLTYKDTVPWAESMRLELTADHMPPWYAEEDPHRLSARELDILLTWASGGTPEGPSKRLPQARLSNGWRLGRPDLQLQAPSPFTLEPGKMEDTIDVMLQDSGAADRWIRALDVLPGTSAIVRGVTVYTKTPNAESTVASWLPGDDPVAMPSAAAMRWSAGAQLRARIHYRKTWTYEAKAVTDRTSVGIYLLSHAPQHELTAWTIGSDASVLDRQIQVVAVSLEGGASDDTVKLTITRPGGSSSDLISLLSRPEWNRRYGFPDGITLPKGSRLELSGPPDVRARLDVIQP